MDNKHIHDAIRRLRRTHSPNADIMLLCSELEKLIGEPPAKVAPMHPLWEKEPPQK